MADRHGSVSLMLALLFFSLLDENFILFDERDGVKVYQRNGAEHIEYGAEGDFDAPPECVLRELIDYASHPRWVKQLRESRVLAKSGETLTVYQRLTLPVIADRDFTLRVTWGQRGAIFWMRFQNVSDAGPAPASGVVRMPIHEGEWLLEPRGTATHATYRVRMDLGGTLPSWMARRQAAKDVPSLFRGMRNHLRDYR